MEYPQLSALVDMDSPFCVLAEVEEIASLVDKEIDFPLIAEVFEDVVKLFAGEYPGYRECVLEYHDLKHTTDTFIAMARLIHGGCDAGKVFSGRNVTIALITALLHDTGYIRTDAEPEGTGAQFTATHIDRSAVFMKGYFPKIDLAAQDYAAAEAILRCTGLNVRMKDIKFASAEVELLGKMLGTADLLGQMADRTYLEKLLFLYYEFKEGGIGAYRNELDLLEKTVGFYEMVVNRLTSDLGGVDKYMRRHFKTRWNIDRSLYAEAMEGQIQYLIKILDEHRDDYRSHLKRGGLVGKVRKAYG